MLILPADSFVAVVNAEADGDGIAEMFAGADVVIIVESAAAQSDEADNHAARASFLWRIRERSDPPSTWLRLGGRYGTKITTAGGILLGKLGFDSRAEFGIELVKFEGHG